VLTTRLAFLDDDPAIMVFAFTSLVPTPLSEFILEKPAAP